MPQNSERIAIDLNNWKDKTSEEIRQDLASFPIESANLPIEKRVSVVAIKLSSFEKLVNPSSKSPEDIATKKIYGWAEKIKPAIEIWTDSPTPNESEILSGMKSFIDFNPGEIMVWLSPAEKGIYEESRIGIYQVISVNKEKYLFFRSLCGTQDTEQCKGIVTRLLPYSDKEAGIPEFIDPAITRATPIAVEIPGESLIDFLGSKIPDMPLIWEAILKGEDLKMKIKTISVVSELITEESTNQIKETNCFYRQIELGAFLEKELQRKLNISLKSGSCGILYSHLNHFITPILSGATESPSRRHCGKCGKHGYFSPGEICPYSENSQS